MIIKLLIYECVNFTFAPRSSSNYGHFRPESMAKTRRLVALPSCLGRQKLSHEARKQHEASCPGQPGFWPVLGLWLAPTSGRLDRFNLVG